MADDKKDPKKDAKPDSAPEKGAEGEGAAPPPAQSKRKLILIIAAVVVMVLAAGGGAAVFLLGGSEKPADEHAADAHGTDAHGEQAVHLAVLEVPDMVVNLTSDGKTNRYLKLKVSLEVGGEEALKALETLMPRIVDDFQIFLRQLRVEDLQGSAGIYRLKEGLLLRANQTAQPTVVNNVLFREVLVQ